MAGRGGQKRRNGGCKEGGGAGRRRRSRRRKGRRTAVRYSLVRHIRDQPTGTLMLAVVILRFSLKELLFLAHVRSPLFYFRRPFQIQGRRFPRCVPAFSSIGLDCNFDISDRSKVETNTSLNGNYSTALKQTQRVSRLIVKRVVAIVVT